MSADQATGADEHYGYDLASNRRRTVSAALRWRARVIWFMVWGCAAVVLVLVITFLTFSGIFETSESDVVDLQDVATESVNVGDLKFTGFDRKNQAYAITADAATQDEDRPNIVYLDNVRAEMRFRGSGDTVFVTAERGIYDTEAESVRLETNIRMTSTSHYTAELASAEVFLKEGRVRSDEPVVVTTSSGKLWSNGLDMWDKGKRILFRNRVRVRYDVKDRPAGDG